MAENMTRNSTLSVFSEMGKFFYDIVRLNVWHETTPKRSFASKKRGITSWYVILDEISYHHAVLGSVAIMSVIMVLLACLYKKYNNIDCLPESKHESEVTDDPFIWILNINCQIN